jgi:hypothetical protein
MKGQKKPCVPKNAFFGTGSTGAVACRRGSVALPKIYFAFEQNLI